MITLEAVLLNAMALILLLMPVLCATKDDKPDEE